jgi:acid phosphatase type 7
VEGGTRSWVVGTGGAELYPVGAPLALAEAVWDRAHGVLELVLRPDGYDWVFRPAIGEPFEDVGSGSC